MFLEVKLQKRDETIEEKKTNRTMYCIYGVKNACRKE
jgi:hypothetical protein